MSRARIAALVLVNWKGVFYERYQLDRYVTALEGANGAGKTTVMIGAYVALLPDMSKLRFTNLGETAAIGGDRGIYGRLGEPGRPSYTVLDLEVGDERVLAGVRLVRATEPTVEPTTFLVTGLAPTVRLSDILLVRRLDGDHVPELDEVKAAVAAAGGTIEVFKSIKDYFAALFERGVTPMRLASDEERGKLNELLRTSMTGGISRALTTELRGFLLKEETGLGDTLSHMRANLAACARTRTEVAESRHLEREITAIYEAGADMFAAAVHATREAAREVEEQLGTARTALDEADATEQALAAQAATLAAREHALADQGARARADLAAAIAARERRLAREGLVARLASGEGELAALTAAERDARATKSSATTARAAAREERTRALAAYDRAARGLANLQAGLDELVRRAHAHAQLARRLDDARGLLARPALAIEDAERVVGELERERDELERARARHARDARDLAARRAEHARAVEALARIEEAGTGTGRGTGTTESELDRARAVLARLAEREASVARAGEMARELDDATRLAARQQVARDRARRLGIASGEAVARELAIVEQQLAEAATAVDALRATSAETAQRRAALRATLATVEDRQARWELASAAAARLGGDPPPRGHAELAAVRERLVGEHLQLGAERARIEADRVQLAQRVAELERAGTSLDPELVRLRDELGAELVAARYEDLDVAAASWVEARLGPLAGALIVDDLDVAIRAVETSERTARSVYLVRAGTDLAAEPPEELDDLADVRDVVASEPWGVRLTRRVPRPSLGRRARERQLTELRDALARGADALDVLAAKTAALAARRRDADVLDAHVEIFAEDAPAIAARALADELAALELADTARTSELAAHATRTVALRGRRDGLRALLADAALLDPPDHAARAAALAAALAERDAIVAELARLAAPRQTLTELLPILRDPPPDDAAIAVADARARAIDARLDAIASTTAALADVIRHRGAADGGAASDAEAALGSQQQLAPALEAQHAAARDAVEAAQAAEATVETAWETATAAAQVAEAARLAAEAARARTAAELAALGSEPATTDDVAAVAARADEVEREARALATKLALLADQRQRAERATTELRARVAGLVRESEPTRTAWQELRAKAEAESLLHGALAATPARAGSVPLAAEAWSKREVLRDRVAVARGGEALATQLRDDTPDGAGCLRAWCAVREWLRRRVPAQIAEVDEPVVALERLRDHLDVLEGRLARQEHDLRGASEDVARGIDVQVRRAHGQVRRLNQQLEGIAFGSIHGIRVEIRRIERMEQILRALRLGETQELLFVSSVPIEEALDEIFRRYGGGRGGGQRLLDYREYLELAVEIRRQTSGDWEPASPTRLSTGEAIGVGAALMMVVLTEWERDANLLRAARTGGCVRFLFLDEANRLSRDNLGVLFELCRTLELQLLVAAPEVARAEGNTTYRLVRHVDDAGREAVIVSGRRGIAAAELPT